MAQQQIKRMNRVDVILLAIFALITFFVSRDALPTDIMESRNIVTAREIVADGNWLVPTMNGELRLEKPPLPTWVAAVVEKVCPGSLSAQRFAAGIMGCLWTLYLFLLVRYVSRRNDLPTATVLVFLTCYNLILMGRSATWDIYCHAFMMAAIYYITRAFYDDHHYRQWLALAGLLMGLSFLSKGPVSFYALLLPYVIMLVVLPRPGMKGKWGSVFVMILITIAVGGWWYFYLLAEHPQEVSAVIHKESGAWSGHNVRPWYYYWRFFLEMGAWAFLMLAALAFHYWKKHISVKREYLLSITWAVTSIILLSLMPEKKTRYLLPSLAPCSIVVACLLVHFKQGARLDKFSRWLYRGNGFLMTLIVALLPVATYFFGVRRGIISWWGEAGVIVAMLLIAAWLLQSTLRWKPMSFAGGIAVLFAFAECFLLPTIGHSFGNPDEKSIAAIRTDKRVNNLKLYHSDKEPIRIELVYDAEKKILPLDLGDSAAVGKAMPCALVSQKWASEAIPAAVLANIDTLSIGTFDDNKHPKTDRHYTKAFINHVTVLWAKK